MKHNDVCNAIDNFYKITTYDDEYDFCDAVETSSLFKKAVKDYSRIIKACENEGVSVSDEVEEFKEEFVSLSSVSSRLELITAIQDDIKSMIDVCSYPPKDIVTKYSEDLVSRIENGIIDDDFYGED
jgi:vacuolar-type H+-ATPase subunit I/STV1